VGLSADPLLRPRSYSRPTCPTSHGRPTHPHLDRRSRLPPHIDDARYACYATPQVRRLPHTWLRFHRLSDVPSAHDVTSTLAASRVSPPEAGGRIATPTLPRNSTRQLCGWACRHALHTSAASMPHERAGIHARPKGVPASGRARGGIHAARRGGHPCPPHPTCPEVGTPTTHHEAKGAPRSGTRQVRCGLT